MACDGSDIDAKRGTLTARSVSVERRRVRVALATALVLSMNAVVAQDVAAPPPDRLSPIEPAIVEYRWVFLVPHWVVETRTYASHVHAPTFEPRRVDYPSLEFTTEHRKIGRVPEFSCKYADFWLPNACTTVWRDLYVDVPVPVVRRESIDVDVLTVSEATLRTSVDVPRLVWKEESLVVSLPALAVRSQPQQAQR
jgi:hypothetical protein